MEYIWDPRLDRPETALCQDKNTEYIDLFRSMVLIRQVERKLADGRKHGLINGPVHLGIGQEAIAPGISAHLRSTDAVFGAHRSHSHILALKTSVNKLISEVLAKSDGLCQGRGGSMHLVDRSVGFLGSVPIVAGTVPLAVGAALAAKRSGFGNISVAYLGDGACEEGVVHESLNMASILNLPVLFVVENNLYASHMHISERQPSRSTVRFAEANGIINRIVDGNDVVEVERVAGELIKAIRTTQKPAFLECITYRWLGHVDFRDDIDVGLTRSMEEVNHWKKRDPILRLERALLGQKFVSGDSIERIRVEVQEEVDRAWLKALEGISPSTAELTSFTFV